MNGVVASFRILVQIGQQFVSVWRIFIEGSLNSCLFGLSILGLWVILHLNLRRTVQRLLHQCHFKPILGY